jgi:hypothetical protein
MLKKDLEDIGGFDERYAPGLAYEDDEFLARVKRAGIEVRIIDDPFVIHQKHKRTDYGSWTKPQYLLNKTLYETVTAPGKFVRPPNNTYYSKYNNPATTTHIPLIKTILELYNPRFILELGIGRYSTPLFGEYVKSTGFQYRGIENDERWIADIKDKNPDLDIVYHDMEGVPITSILKNISQYKQDIYGEYYGAQIIPEVSPRLLFVDNYGSCRVIAINTLKDKFDFIIFHDCELAGAFEYSYDKINTSGFRVFYLKNNLSWSAVMAKEGWDTSALFTAILPHIAQHIESYPQIKSMELSPNYL